MEIYFTFALGAIYLGKIDLNTEIKMSNINNYNIIQIVEESLVKELKPEITKRITDRIIDEIRKDIKPIIESEVDKLVIEGVDKMKNLMTMRDEIKVYMSWGKNEITK